MIKLLANHQYLNFSLQSSVGSYQFLDLSENINKVIKYFSNFDYVPTIDEIHQYYPKKVSKNTVGEYGIKSSKFKVQSAKFKKERERRKKISERKVKIIDKYIKLLSKIPQIKLVGLSGTVAMNNTKENDDIDLFIITAKNKLFTGRIITLVLAQILGLRRRRPLDKQLTANNVTIEQCNNLNRNKVCLNLFFDESNLQVPKYKQTEYVAHEVLQMKPLINKDQIYERFLKANEWVFGFFPNAAEDFRGLKADFHRYQQESANNPWRSIFNKIEQMLKNFQLYLIRKHRTTEIVTNTQLWFFPDDYEKKISV